MARRVLTPETIALVDKLNSEGEEIRRIAAAAGVSARYVSARKKAAGLARHYVPMTEREAREIEILWSTGTPRRLIASYLDRTEAAIGAHLRLHGFRHHTWTNHKVLAQNMLDDNDVAVVGYLDKTMIVFQDGITSIAKKHGVSRRTVRRALLEIPATEEERCAPRGASLPHYVLDRKASDYFQDLREEFGDDKITPLIDRMRAGEDPKDVVDDLGIVVNMRQLRNHFRWYEAGSIK